MYLFSSPCGASKVPPILFLPPHLEDSLINRLVSGLNKFWFCCILLLFEFENLKN